MNLIKKLFGSYSDREIKRIISTVDEIEKLDPIMTNLSDEELRAKTDEFKTSLSNGKTLEDILPEA